MQRAQDFVPNLTGIWQSVLVTTKPGISNMFDIHHGLGAVVLQSSVVTAVINPTVTQFMDGRYRQVVKSDDSCIKSKWQSPCWHHNQSEWIRSQFGMCSKPMTRLWQDMTRRTWLPPNQLLSTCGEMPWVAVASVQCVTVWIHTPQVVQWPPAMHT